MHELGPDNTADYLRQTGRVGADEPVEVEALGWGVSNVVLRVRTPTRLFVLKQSRPQLRTRAAWFSDVSRVYREQEVMELLGPLLPGGSVPEVLFADRPNYVLAMSHAPVQARVWKETLLAGEADPRVAEWAGTLLGTMHQRTAQERHRLSSLADCTVFVQLRVDPFYRTILARHPDLAPCLTPLIERMLRRQDALCHGDYSPKNFLVHDGRFTLVDYEAAYLGDPTMDVGFFLSHLLLKAIHHAPHARPLLDLTRAFWRGYNREVRFEPAAELTHWGVAHCGACLLARVDGTSPVDYLDEARRDVARRLGRDVLATEAATWDDVLSRFDRLTKDNK